MSQPKTQTAVVCSRAEESAEAARGLGKELRTQFGNIPPDVVILFSASRHNAAALLRGLEEACSPKIIVGCSSAGEFTNDMIGEGHVCALGIRSSDLTFAVGTSRKLAENREAAAREIVATFNQPGDPSAYSAALVLTDGLAGHADELIEHLTFLTGGNHQFFGGGAGDDGHFKRTEVFLNQEIATGAAVALEIRSSKPIGVGVRHGWYPASKPMRVTEARGSVLVSLNAMAGLEVVTMHAENTRQAFDPADPMPFFLHNILGIDMGDGFRLRVPLALQDDGSILCAAEIPEGASVCIMATDAASARQAATAATEAAMSQLKGHPANAALFFDCVATRLRMGHEFGDELAAVKAVLGPIPLAGCNTYGQVARSEGQFSGFHNCTAVVCVLPG